MLTANKIYNMEAIEFMKQIDSKAVDLVLCDLPYEVTQNDWDKKINLKSFFQESWRVLKENGIIVLTSQQPFTTALINCDRENFRYHLIWNKGHASNFFMAKKQPLKIHEEILVFYKKFSNYNPQMVETENKRDRRKENSYKKGEKTKEDCVFSNQKIRYSKDYNPNLKYPKSIIYFPKHLQKDKRLHHSQKPVELFEWLVKTYSNEGDLILDCTIGIGTTAIACKNTNRNFIGNDLNQEFVKIANQQLSQDKLNAFSNTQNSTSSGFPTENSPNISLKDNSNKLSQISSNDETSLNNNIKRNFGFCSKVGRN